VFRERSRLTFHISPHASQRKYAEASLAFSPGVAIFAEPQNGHAVGTGSGSTFVIMYGRPLSARPRQSPRSSSARASRAVPACAGGGASCVCDPSEIVRDRRFA
jgi:hypothetical protein